MANHNDRQTERRDKWGKTIRTMQRGYKRETVQIISTQYCNVSYHAGTTSDDSYWTDRLRSTIYDIRRETERKRTMTAWPMTAQATRTATVAANKQLGWQWSYSYDDISQWTTSNRQLNIHEITLMNNARWRAIKRTSRIIQSVSDQMK